MTVRNRSNYRGSNLDNAGMLTVKLGVSSMSDTGKMLYISTDTSSSHINVSPLQLAKFWEKPEEEVVKWVDKLEKLQNEGRATNKEWDKFAAWLMEERTYPEVCSQCGAEVEGHHACTAFDGDTEEES